MKEDRLQLFVDAHIHSQAIDGSLGLVSGNYLYSHAIGPFLKRTMALCIPVQQAELFCNQLSRNTVVLPALGDVHHNGSTCACRKINAGITDSIHVLLTTIIYVFRNSGCICLLRD